MSWNHHSLAFNTPMGIQIEMQINMKRILKAQSALWKNSIISSRAFYVNLLFYFLKTFLPKLKSLL